MLIWLFLYFSQVLLCYYYLQNLVGCLYWHLNLLMENTRMFLRMCTLKVKGCSEISNNSLIERHLVSQMGFPGGISGKESACQCRRHKRREFDPWVRKWQPTLVILPGKFKGQRTLMAYSPWGHRELTQLSTQLLVSQTTPFQILVQPIVNSQVLYVAPSLNLFL